MQTEETKIWDKEVEAKKETVNETVFIHLTTE